MRASHPPPPEPLATYAASPRPVCRRLSGMPQPTEPLTCHQASGEPQSLYRRRNNPQPKRPPRLLPPPLPVAPVLVAVEPRNAPAQYHVPPLD